MLFRWILRMPLSCFLHINNAVCATNTVFPPIFDIFKALKLSVHLTDMQIFSSQLDGHAKKLMVFLEKV